MCQGRDPCFQQLVRFLLANDHVDGAYSKYLEYATTLLLLLFKMLKVKSNKPCYSSINRSSPRETATFPTRLRN